VISRKSARYRASAIARVSATDKLIPFVVSAMTDNKFMIDSESLSISSDGIVSLHFGDRQSFRRPECELRGNQLRDRRTSDLCPWPLGQDLVKGARRSVGKNRGQLAQSTPRRAVYRLFLHPVGITIRNADEVREALRRGGHPSMMRR
jgi:hypothetical protein